MNSDRVKGTIDILAGSAKRMTGELTGDTPLQIKGIAQQVKGRIEDALGKVKDGLHEANLEANRPPDKRP